MVFHNIIHHHLSTDLHQTSVIEGPQVVTYPDGLLQYGQHLLQLRQGHLGHRLTLQLLLGNLLRPAGTVEGRGGQGDAAGSSQFVMVRTSS